MTLSVFHWAQGLDSVIGWVDCSLLALLILSAQTNLKVSPSQDFGSAMDLLMALNLVEMRGVPWLDPWKELMMGTPTDW